MAAFVGTEVGIGTGAGVEAGAGAGVGGGVGTGCSCAGGFLTGVAFLLPIDFLPIGVPRDPCNFQNISINALCKSGRNKRIKTAVFCNI